MDAQQQVSVHSPFYIFASNDQFINRNSALLAVFQAGIHYVVELLEIGEVVNYLFLHFSFHNKSECLS